MFVCVWIFVCVCFDGFLGFLRFDGVCVCGGGGGGGGSVCVVMGLNRLIGVSWVFVCVALCVESVLEVEGEREGKKRLLESLGKPKVSVIKKKIKK